MKHTRRTAHRTRRASTRATSSSRSPACPSSSRAARRCSSWPGPRTAHGCGASWSSSRSLGVSACRTFRTAPARARARRSDDRIAFSRILLGAGACVFTVGGDQRRVEIHLIAHPDDDQTEARRRLTEQFATFDAAKARCFLASDREHLLAVIEAGFGDFDDFNRVARSLLVGRVSRRDSGSWSRLGTPLNSRYALNYSCNLVPLLWTGVPTPSAPADRQDPLPIFRCPGNASMLRRVFPDHLISDVRVVVRW